ncbi:MAG: hypothetical protein DMG82_17475 [Acidobacteria bacterium]|nr:MAG: hypothetical protein DMG82_17475 [Acidobacteriota bacterium]PYX45417.1 MAG: hypothetical protein DMG83_09985 [Acidobacteriota bacterium]
MPKKTVAATSPTNGSNVPAEIEESQKRVRVSQADIPAYSLDEAMRVPKAIVDNYNSKPTTPLKVAAAMKIGPNASQFKMLTGAAIAYGLTEGGAQSDLITLTPLCLRIFKPKVEGDDLIAKREAFLKPRVIGQFLRQYDGGAVPKADIAENVLSGDMGVPEQRAEAVFNMILDGAKPLGLITTIKDKLYVSLEGAGTAVSFVTGLPAAVGKPIKDWTKSAEGFARVQSFLIADLASVRSRRVSFISPP